MAHWQLLISADRIAAGFADDGSRIGVTFFLGAADGTVLAQARAAAAPSGCLADS
ncbi:hypothetical protein G3I59_09795 [Amycolatopsis rubida]|uniref:Uncharacterized protein n=1 Tax=Amycolatopsis rubida TaxID=112413 RepID=A0A1I5HT55_9PSEU|nr:MULTISPECIES: hypothetical protein [Amycolatopsis]MYW90886.1 hypothetical protein [Amycolatopsis rubida]NEC55871.1 hypothetical protein [Amycolatopsis rubida]OAP26048.1 hypothetical protein A4R44_03425 [Amycolatopsis sp. M39]SFO51011.1 hypothetical protein SAMN05421854_10239 [Amycolatopsis rubida]